MLGFDGGVLSNTRMHLTCVPICLLYASYIFVIGHGPTIVRLVLVAHYQVILSAKIPRFTKSNDEDW